MRRNGYFQILTTSIVLFSIIVRETIAGKIIITDDDYGDSVQTIVDFEQLTSYSDFISGITYNLVTDVDLEVYITAVGGSGGTGVRRGSTGGAGLGGETEGTFTFKKNQPYTLMVGAAGDHSSEGSQGGFPGGGNGASGKGGGGGGLTGLFLGSATFENAILIAGGGGGGGTDPCNGGVGGGLIGQDAPACTRSDRNGFGGSQTEGGRGRGGAASQGSQLQGGSYGGAAGGGAGYYGGGGGKQAGGGGGGSGYVHPELIHDGVLKMGQGIAPNNPPNEPDGSFVMHLISIPAGGGGDPHFTTLHGVFFSYHGECDLVMMKSPSFHNGEGLDLHIRTTRIENARGKYSFISGAAIRIGKDVLEFQDDGSIILNGQTTKDHGGVFAGYPLTLTRKGSNKNIFVYDLQLGSDKSIQIRANTWNSMVFVDASGSFPIDTNGLLGAPDHDALVARDGRTILMDDWNKFGEEWQVRHDEHKLFKDTNRFPQHPITCLYESHRKTRKNLRQHDQRRRLHEDHSESITLEAATEACNSSSGQLKQFCVDDVLATGDLDLAKDSFYTN
eukprot:CAMPEP_0204616772 /NCGR_PEP_ID=MMETSP0717-20131115/3939_1 /ASSEMBLY_ACC=CAM_ASM_000666 /TAXON_ID=230516 /ORGANISM="Chaetoceros curvisetus" /LENGTH=558 /DNA_ID=CAMNT_0051630119 /DNA_START=103 /DNA_END=1779 /DNA_ORIENTATION=-